MNLVVEVGLEGWEYQWVVRPFGESYLVFDRDQGLTTCGMESIRGSVVGEIHQGRSIARECLLVGAAVA